MSGKGKLRLTNKFYFLLAILAAFVLAPAVCFADDPPLPCSGDDPYGNCPLDTNVWLLVIIALVAGAVFIYRQQKVLHKKA
jgi:hypothetical protein